MIEYSSNRNIQAILRTAPQWVSDDVDRLRKQSNLPPLNIRGVPNHVGTESQIAHNEHALLQRKAELLREQAIELRQYR